MTQTPETDYQLSVSRTLDEEIRSLVFWYGREAVRDAVDRHAKLRAGRKSEYWPYARVELEKDAIQILTSEGKIALPSKYDVILRYKNQIDFDEFESKFVSGMKRALRNHVWWMLLFVSRVGEKSPYSHVRYQAILAHLSKRLGAKQDDAEWQARIARIDQMRATYRQRFGCLPPDALSCSEILAGLAQPEPEKSAAGVGPLSLLGEQLSANQP